MPPRLETVSVAGRLLLLGVLLLLLGPCQAEELEIRSTDAIAQPVIEAKIQQMEADADIAPEVRDKLLELYRKALSNVQAAKDNAASAATFRRRASRAPTEIEAIRAALAPKDADEYPPRRTSRSSVHRNGCCLRHAGDAGCRRCQVGPDVPVAGRGLFRVLPVRCRCGTGPVPPQPRLRQIPVRTWVT